CVRDDGEAWLDYW
nr:immunoglobulin heavy chain junction region [Macaca mulatta]